MVAWKVSRQPVLDHNLNTMAYQLHFFDIDNAYCPEKKAVDFSSFFAEKALVKALLGRHKPYLCFNAFELALIEPESLVEHDLFLNFNIAWLLNEKMVRRLLQYRDLGIDISIRLSDCFGSLPEILDMASSINLNAENILDLESQQKIKELLAADRYFIAESINGHEQFLHAIQLPFKGFHGRFIEEFCLTDHKDSIDAGTKAVILRLIVVVLNSQLSMGDISLVVQYIPEFEPKLINICNSAAMSFQRNVSSVDDAIKLLGMNEIRQLACMILMSAIQVKPDALIFQTLLRAKHMEFLTEQITKLDPSQAFLVGLFSTLPAVMQQPMDTLLSSMPCSDLVKHALIEGKGPLNEVYQLVLAYERAEWDKLIHPTLSIDDMAIAYNSALPWVDHITGQLGID